MTVVQSYLTTRLGRRILGGMGDARGTSTRTAPLLVLSFLVALLTDPFAVSAATVNFTRGAATAQKFGVHEIVLTGNGSVTNPFDTDATVTFTPPSGAAQAKTVKAFYDGGKTWRESTSPNQGPGSGRPARRPTRVSTAKRGASRPCTLHCAE